MNRPLPALPAALLLLVAPAAVQAQRAEIYADVGVTWSGPLVNDGALGGEIEVTPKLAPTVRVGAAVPFAERLRLGAEAAFATGGLESDSDGIVRELPSVRTLALVATLSGPIADRLRWRAAVGTLKYLPSEDEGIFARGGPFTPLAGLGLEYRLPATRALDLRFHARADVHPFKTDELTARGFGGSQWVPRVAVGVGIARGGA